MDYKHEEETVLMQYGGGDPCPPGTSVATLNEFHQGKDTRNCAQFAQVVSSLQPGPQSPETPVRKSKH